MRTTSVRASGSLVVAVFVMASWIALLCETRCLVPERFHGELPPFAGWSSDADPVPQHNHPVPSQVKLCILALPGTFLSAQTSSLSATVAAIPAKASDGVSAEVLTRSTAFSLATIPLFVSPKSTLFVLRI